MNNERNTDEDWRPRLEDEHGRRATEYKWGIGAGSNEPTVWEVSGPGDGFPSHDTFLTTAWGRNPDIAGGDLIGNAIWEPPQLTIRTYYSENVPERIVEWFLARHPDGRLA